MAVLSGIFAVLVVILKIILWVLLALLVLLAVVLLCPARVDIAYENEAFSLRAGILCFSLRLWPRPEKPAPAPEKPASDGAPPKKSWIKRMADSVQQKAKALLDGKKRKKKPAAKVAKPKARLTLDLVCEIVRSAGGFLRAVLGALHITRIHIYVPVGGGDAADTAITYGKTNAGVYAALGFLNRFLYLDFDELRLEPDFEGARAGTERFSCRVSAQMIFLVIAGVRLILELYREKVLDVLL